MASDGITVFMADAQNGADYNKPYSDNQLSRQSCERLKKQISVENLITLDQRHSADITEVNAMNFTSVNGSAGDGLFSSGIELALGIMTADCFPVMLAGKKYIAALHCGWRGTVKGIIDNAAAMFAEHGDAPEYAYIGAGISKDAFCVRDDFIAEVKRYIDPEKYLSEKNRGRFFDLARLIKDRLKYHNVGIVESLGVCSYRDKRFHSYRRDGKDAGRSLSVIYRRGH
ncbi:MAG: polyphenol oxidase family protein [Deferribacteraceae bacterium]|jgi:YfiH family protein|nr:polyphenol oxidase family protein [Deferribacteraceae bacterium]